MGYVRSRLGAVLLALATAVAGVLLAGAPAQARWTEASTTIDHRVCKEPRLGGAGWTFQTRARKPARTEDARAGVAIHVRGDRRQHWSSGWLDDRGLARGWVRTRHRAGVRVHLWQEAGDRGSGVGTALQQTVLRPGQIARCG
ncbi:hypothetical protein [Nocardioides sp. GXQ0305]|uniref:hypothetical protein n=1 Tax=Nocardioides sp. GXQ0305 TaxID=3423912 RepID=UPI003D7D3E02